MILGNASHAQAYEIVTQSNFCVMKTMSVNGQTPAEHGLLKFRLINMSIKHVSSMVMAFPVSVRHPMVLQTDSMNYNQRLRPTGMRMFIM
jgi:hypothetical protein